MCERISSITKNIVIVDNNSDFRPMVDFLDNCQFKTIRFDQNHGHKVYELDVVKDILGSLFLLTDPDIEVSDFVTSETIEKMFEISEQYRIRKVGLALDISGEDIREDVKYEGKDIKKWESKFWADRVADQELEMYWADVDTTFCLVNNKYENWPYIRIAGPYTSKHLPWYKDWEKSLMPGEYDSYMYCNRSTNWCKK